MPKKLEGLLICILVLCHELHVLTVLNEYDE